MNLATNIIFLGVTIMFMGVYGYSFVLNLIRAIKTNKNLKANPQYIDAKVTEVTQVKKRVYITVQYTSKSNLQTFTSIYELTDKEFNDQYYVGQEVRVIYPEVEGTKRIHCFPTYLEGTKLGLESGPIFTDALIFASGIFIFAFSLYNMLIKNAFEGNVPLFSTVGETEGVMTWLSIIVFLIIYLVMMAYILERLVGISREHSENYLKICGLKAKAEVLTYKLSKNKNAQGVRQSQIKIEFRTNKGEKINTEIASFMYTEQADQFIDILYDGRRPQMAVYLKS